MVLHDEMIQDRIVVRIRDVKLSKKLLMNSELTLDKAMTEVCLSEAVRKQQPLLRGESLSSACGSLPVGAIVHKRNGSGMKQS